MVVLNVTVNNCTPQTIVIGRRGTLAVKSGLSGIHLNKAGINL